ncbi:hypothetical protein [Agrobacterium pusense]|uniref:hypothetical protein n=1 Tax=Agrobacterium pusense TaxID=648995 RepID=UPI00111403DE|nr:hypothetical protein [Agrobacterium pusense]WKD44371.1 hypothetical protein M8C82_01850 [Agrobacterium pusense]
MSNFTGFYTEILNGDLVATGKMKGSSMPTLDPEYTFAIMMIGAYTCLYVEKIPPSPKDGMWKELKSNFWEVTLKFALLASAILISRWVPIGEGKKLLIVFVTLLIAFIVSKKFKLHNLEIAVVKAAAGAGALYFFWMAPSLQ